MPRQRSKNRSALNVGIAMKNLVIYDLLPDFPSLMIIISNELTPARQRENVEVSIIHELPGDRHGAIMRVGRI
jgi:hypothetical protein